MRARQAPAEHKIGERRAVFREQLTNIAFRDLQASRHIGERQVVVSDPVANMVLDRPQPRGAQAPFMQAKAAVAAEQQRGEAMHVGGNHAA